MLEVIFNFGRMLVKIFWVDILIVWCVFIFLGRFEREISVGSWREKVNSLEGFEIWGKL